MKCSTNNSILTWVVIGSIVVIWGSLFAYTNPTKTTTVNPPETKVELIAVTPEEAKVYRIENSKTIVPTIIVITKNGNVAVR